MAGNAFSVAVRLNNIASRLNGKLVKNGKTAPLTGSFPRAQGSICVQPVPPAFPSVQLSLSLNNHSRPARRNHQHSVLFAQHFVIEIDANDSMTPAGIASRLTQIISSSPNAELAAAAAAWGKEIHLPGFAMGINRVPYDMTARLHADEAVVPAVMNPFNPNAKTNGMGGNTDRLEGLVEGLTKEVQRLQSIVNDGNRQATRTADATNGRPEMPMLVETV